MNYVWFIVEIVVMGGVGVVEVLYVCEVKEQENFVVFLVEKEVEYIKLFVNFYNVVKYGYIDDVIELCNICFCIICVL